MKSPKAFSLAMLVMFNIVETKGLLTSDNTSTTDQTESSYGCIVDRADIMQILHNQTTELEILKQQTENDVSTILLLQNRVFYLETELNKLNKSKSNPEMSTYLMSMNNLIQNMATNEENDRNLTQRLNALERHFDDLNVQVRYTSLSLLDIQSLTEELNGSFIQRVEDRIKDVITSMKFIDLYCEKIETDNYSFYLYAF